MTNLPLVGIFSVTCEYRRKNTNNLKWAAGFHTGIDLIGGNDVIYATCNGIITKTGFDKSYGNYIVLKNDVDGRFHWFCHLSEIWIKTNQRVTRASRIGKMGATGNVTGKHLHYEIRNASNIYGDVVSPADYMGIENIVSENLNSNNYNITSPNNEPSILKVGDIKKLKVRTNVREYPNLDGEAHLYIPNTTIKILETAVNKEDGYVWDKIEIVYAKENDLKIGYIARTCERYM